MRLSSVENGFSYLKGGEEMTFLITIFLLAFSMAFTIMILYAILSLTLGGDVKANNLFIRNRLYMCKDYHCKRLYRHYQSTMSSKKNHYCPHCQDWKTTQKKIKFERYNARKPNTEWLNNITKNKK